MREIQRAMLSVTASRSFRSSQMAPIDARHSREYVGTADCTQDSQAECNHRIGLDLSLQFFTEVGLPAIQQELPTCVELLAAGPLPGSQAHGNDDEVSRDHGWGPGFVVWLSDEDYDRFAAPLQALLDRLPRSYRGCTWQLEPKHTCRVYELSRCTRNLLGVETAPAREIDWLHIPEMALFEAAYRPIFYDPTGHFAAHFAVFRQYPEGVWKKRLAACLAWTWRWGIEYVRRAERRGDTVTATMDWCRFAEYAMKACFLLNHRYAPYHKWLYREFTKLPSLAPELKPILDDGFARLSGRAALSEQVIARYVAAVRDLGFEPIDRVDEQDHISFEDQVLYRYARGIQQTISDPAIRSLSLYGEILAPATVTSWGYVVFERRVPPE